jgi:hypothetical protein
VIQDVVVAYDRRPIARNAVPTMHDWQGIVGLWPERIRLYLQAMARKLYNVPLLGNTKAFWTFLDAYATSLDIDPNCGTPTLHKSPEALWEDFVRVASDANSAFLRHTKS